LTYHRTSSFSFHSVLANSLTPYTSRVWWGLMENLTQERILKKKQNLLVDKGDPTPAIRLSWMSRKTNKKFWKDGRIKAGMLLLRRAFWNANLRGLPVNHHASRLGMVGV
jgi:hypothetical protein